MQAVVLPAGDGVGQPLGQPFAQGVGHGIHVRAGNHIGGRALHQGHLSAALGQRRGQGHGRGAAADHRHPLAGAVQILRPLLRMHDASPESLLALEARRMAALIAVVAAAHQQEVAGEAGRAAIPAPRFQRPLGVGAAPGGGLNLMLEADLLHQPIFLGGFPNVSEDGRAVGDGLRLPPGLEGITQGVHVAVGADARIAEQIPGAADALPAFQNGEGLAWAAPPQVAGRANAGQPGADDQHIEAVFKFHPAASSRFNAGGHRRRPCPFPQGAAPGSKSSGWRCSRPGRPAGARRRR